MNAGYSPLGWMRNRGHVRRVARRRWRQEPAADLGRSDAGRLGRLARPAVRPLSVLISGTINFLFIGPVRIFGLVEIPRVFDPDADEWLRVLTWQVHHYSWPALLALIGLHSAAALVHHYVRRDRILADFLPWRT